MFRLSLVAVSRGHSLIAELGLWAEHVGSAAAAPGSGAQTPQLRCTALVALGQVVSSWTMNQTHIPCIGRWILYHCTTREVLFQVANSYLPAMSSHGGVKERVFRTL